MSFACVSMVCTCVQVSALVSHMPRGDVRQTMLFSATWPREVRGLAAKVLQGSRNPTVHLYVGNVQVRGVQQFEVHLKSNGNQTCSMHYFVLCCSHFLHHLPATQHRRKARYLCLLLSLLKECAGRGVLMKPSPLCGSANLKCDLSCFLASPARK